MIPNRWFSTTREQKNKHPFQQMAWYLQDHSEEIPTDVLDSIVSNLEEIESKIEVK